MGVNIGLQRVASRFGRKLLWRQPSKLSDGAVAQHCAGRNKMVTRAPIDNRVRAAGIVADHTPDHAAVLGGSFGRKEKTVRSQSKVKLVADHAGLHPDTASRGVDFHNTSQLTRNIYHDPPADDLAG